MSKQITSGWQLNNINQMNLEVDATKRLAPLNKTMNCQNYRSSLMIRLVYRFRIFDQRSKTIIFEQNKIGLIIIDYLQLME
jgi:replicative DNA helicase